MCEPALVAWFGNDGIKQRCLRAVGPLLEPDEPVDAIVYTRDFQAAPAAGRLVTPVGGMAALAAVPAFILALTPSRLLVLAANNLNAAHSSLLGTIARAQVRVVAAEPSGKPRRITLSFDGDAGHSFSVPAVWRRDAAAFAAAIG
jgi:hypothetical protein